MGAMPIAPIAPIALGLTPADRLSASFALTALRMTANHATAADVLMAATVHALADAMPVRSALVEMRRLLTIAEASLVDQPVGAVQ